MKNRPGSNVNKENLQPMGDTKEKEKKIWIWFNIILEDIQTKFEIS